MQGIHEDVLTPAARELSSSYHYSEQQGLLAESGALRDFR